MPHDDAGPLRCASLAERCDDACTNLIEERWRRAPGLALRIARDQPGVVERPGRTRFDLSWCAEDRSMHGPLRARWPWLPLADGSLSLVILDRLGEGSADFYVALLDEVVRVLADDGRLLVLETNPWSWLGLRSRFAGRPHALAARRLRAVIGAAGLEEIETDQVLCWPPLPTAVLERHGDWLDRLGGRWLSLPGSVYALSGRKRGSNVIAIPIARDRRHGLLAAPEGMRRAG